MTKMIGSKPAINLHTDGKAHSHLLLEADDRDFRADDKVTVEDKTPNNLKFKVAKKTPNGKRLTLKIKHLTKDAKPLDTIPPTGTLTLTVTTAGGTVVGTPTDIPVNYVSEADPCA